MSAMVHLSLISGISSSIYDYLTWRLWQLWTSCHEFVDRRDTLQHFSGERHRTQHVGWLRAAVLGANDGIISTASLILGVAATNAGQSAVLTAGSAGLVAGALAMAAGEFVSVSAQSDTERADLARERLEHETDPAGELQELAAIYRQRGLDTALALEVATQLTAHDALGSHARDELGISAAFAARPLQAAFSSAASFAMGAALPLLLVLVSPAGAALTLVVGLGSMLSLAVLGMLAARTGGAGLVRSVIRVVLWGAAAMTATWAIGKAFGTVAA
jgi:vacuolar iron transporter family protein